MTYRLSHRTFALLVAWVTLMLLAWSFCEPYDDTTNILHGIQAGSIKWSRGEKDSVSHGDDLNRMVNFTDRLKIAYSPAEEHVNPHDYKLVLDEPGACVDVERATAKLVFLLVLVISSHENFVRRRLIRQTWGSPRELAGRPIVTLFLLARSGDPTLEARVLAESAAHRDLLMEDFRDSYGNLTLKTLMAMKWASSHCPHASFVMKTDDDMFVSYQNLLHYITVSGAPRTNLAFGLVLADQAPIRDPESKWYMPRDTFPGDVYPPWLSGGGFVLSGDVPGRIYAASLRIRHLPLEDVYVGVCLDSLNITPISNRQFNNMHIPYTYCKFRSIITSHHVASEELRNIWRDQRLQKPCWLWT